MTIPLFQKANKQKDAEEKIKKRIADERRAFAEVLGTSNQNRSESQRIVLEIIAREGGVFKPTFISTAMEDTHAAAYRDGGRNMALGLLKRASFIHNDNTDTDE